MEATIAKVTGGVCAACAGALLACGGGDFPAPPGQLAPRSIAAGGMDVRIQPVVAELPKGAAAWAAASLDAAPLAESQRFTMPAQRRANIAVGHEVAHACDVAFQQAVAEATVGIDETFATCTDRDAVELVMLGRAECGLISGQLSARDLRAGLREVRVGVELFALAVAPGSPLRSLTHQQVRQLLTRQVTTWGGLGQSGGDIVVAVPSERSLATRAAKALIAGDNFGASCMRVADDQELVTLLANDPNAIGVVRVSALPRDPGCRLLQIDWCSPTVEAFRYGTYRFGLPMTLVTSGEARGLAAELLSFVRNESGANLLGRTLLLTP